LQLPVTCKYLKVKDLHQTIRFICFCGLLGTLKSFAQSKTDFQPSDYRTQIGFSLKTSLEFGLTKRKPNPIIRIVGNAGVGAIFANSHLYPSFNMEVQFYNGGLGSRSQGPRFLDKNDLDIVAAFTMTAGLKNHLKAAKLNQLADRNIPLYYFADFVYPALQNPFNYSLSVGTNFIFTPFNKEKADQRIGFINFHARSFQVSYYNDGGSGISELGLGDKRDRYYTGGAVLAWHGQPYTALSTIVLSYHKFTGYTKNAFEVSNKLFLNYMTYQDPDQKYYNKSLLSVSAGNPSQGYEAKINSYNSVSLDFQHFIHSNLFNAFHMVPYKPYVSVSGSYHNTYTQIGFK
jgi:hypothetical protein